MFYGFNAFVNDEHIDGPKEQETQCLPYIEADKIAEVGAIGQAGRPGYHELVNSRPAYPGLDAEPAAGYQAAQETGEHGAVHPEVHAQEHGQWDAVLGAHMRVQDHGNEHDDVAEEDGEERLFPVHTLLDEAGGEHVGGNTHGHADPDGGDMPAIPGAGRGGHGREIFAVQRRCGDVFGEFYDVFFHFCFVLAASLKLHASSCLHTGEGFA